VLYTSYLPDSILKVAIMRPKFALSEAEKDTFRKAVEKAKPLTHTKIVKQTKPPTIITPRPTPPEPEEHLAFSDSDNLPSVTGEDYLEFVRTGIQHKVLRKLRGGQYNVEAILDLHRQTVKEAKESLSDFLLTCLDQGIRHALIIHGKGRNIQQPVLKNRLNHWLREIPEVLAFCSAQPKDGRHGALYILIKNKMGER
jgi:DNA-nicking Smr family endonuclease